MGKLFIFSRLFENNIRYFSPKFLKINHIVTNRVDTDQRQGFTLLEMSVVMVIIGSVAAGGMTTFSASLQQRQLQETQYKLQAIQKALYDFSMVNNRFPCPGDITLSISDPNFGAEGVNPGTCISTAR
jgi:prepilin-type N-terminal cleavage/methylation domain-containing protein